MNYTDYFQWNANHVVRFEGPVNEITGAPITNTPAVTFAKARIFHDAKDSYLTVSAAVNDVILNVSDARNYTADAGDDTGDRIVVWMDDNNWHYGGKCTLVNTELNQITMTVPLTVASKKDQRVCVGLGDEPGGAGPWVRDMTYFNSGTEVAGAFDYGWYLNVANQQTNFEIGIVVRVEMEIEASVGVRGGQIIRRRIVGGV